MKPRTIEDAEDEIRKLRDALEMVKLSCSRETPPSHTAIFRFCGRVLNESLEWYRDL